jgi:hypothetical protein
MNRTIGHGIFWIILVFSLLMVMSFQLFILKKTYVPTPPFLQSTSPCSQVTVRYPPFVITPRDPCGQICLTSQKDDEGEKEAGGQGDLHFSIAADPNSPDIVYVGGDRQKLFYNTSEKNETDENGDDDEDEDAEPYNPLGARQYSGKTSSLHLQPLSPLFFALAPLHLFATLGPVLLISLLPSPFWFPSPSGVFPFSWNHVHPSPLVFF